MKYSYLSVAVFLILLGSALSAIYRIYIYPNEISSFHFVDAISRGLVVPICSCLILAFPSRKESNLFRVVSIAVLGGILYELLGMLLGLKSFGLYDLGVMLISGVLTYLVMKILFVLKKKLES